MHYFCFSFGACGSGFGDAMLLVLGHNSINTFSVAFQGIFQEKVTSRRQAELERSRREREEHIHVILQQRREEREAKRKMLFFLKSEEERLNKLREEEESRKREGKG